MNQPHPTAHPIQVVARRTGLTADTIRAWEKRYRAISPARSGNGRRLYSEDDVHRLLLLRRATLTGWAISQVAAKSTADLATLVEEDAAAAAAAPTAATTPAREGDETRQNLENTLQTCLQAIADMNADLMEQTLAGASAQLALPAFLEEFLTSLLHEIGRRWQVGELRVCHEHMASAAIRSYLGSLRLTYAGASGPSIVMTTPPGQLHELGALAAGIVAARQGWQVLYLGPNLPVECIAAAARQTQAKVVGLSLVYPEHDQRLGEDLHRLRDMLPMSCRLVVGGRAAQHYAETLDSLGGHHMASLKLFSQKLAEMVLP